MFSMQYDAIIFLYTKYNRYGVHALVASLDKANVGIPIKLVPLDKIPEISRKYKNPIIAMGFTTIYFVENYDKIKKVLENSRGVKIVGGPHATGDPVGLLNIGFDYVFVGDGEKSLVEFVKEGVTKGIVYKEGDQYIFTGWNRVNLDDYYSFPWWRGIYSPIEIERGCLHACRYCETPFLYGKSRYRSIESVKEHINAMKKANKLHIRFIASDSFSYPYFFDLLEIQGVKLYVGSFPSEVRPENVSEEKLKAMKGRVANKRIIVGAQSGSERMLKIMNRQHTVEDVKNAVELIVKYGFVPEVDFIFGLPGETKEDVEETLNLMEWITAKGGRVHAHAFMPLPGTPWEDKKPGKVPEVIRKFVERLTGKGLAYGYWKEQEVIGRKIYNFYREGKILGFRGWKLVKYKLIL